MLSLLESANSSSIALKKFEKNEEENVALESQLQAFITDRSSGCERKPSLELRSTEFRWESTLAGQSSVHASGLARVLVNLVVC